MSTTPETLLDSLKKALAPFADAYKEGSRSQTLKSESGNCVGWHIVTPILTEHFRRAHEVFASANAAPVKHKVFAIAVHSDGTMTDLSAGPQAAPVLDATGEREAFMRAFPNAHWLEGESYPRQTWAIEKWQGWEARSALSQTIAEEEPKPCCGKPEACSAACVERGRWLERQQPQECGTGAMCCYMAAMRDHEEEQAQELPVLSDEEILAKFEENISRAPAAYLKPGQTIYQATEYELLSFAKDLLSRKPVMSDEDIEALLEEARSYILIGHGYIYNEKALRKLVRTLSRKPSAPVAVVSGDNDGGGK